LKGRAPPIIPAKLVAMGRNVPFKSSKNFRLLRMQKYNYFLLPQLLLIIFWPYRKIKVEQTLWCQFAGQLPVKNP
jgi:hypothetical protein